MTRQCTPCLVDMFNTAQINGTHLMDIRLVVQFLELGAAATSQPPAKFLSSEIM